MRNKLFFGIVVLFYFCSLVFSEEVAVDQTMLAGFINHPFWFQKYLPLEYISDYEVLSEMLIETINAENPSGDNLLENITVEISGLKDNADNDLGAYILNLNAIIFERLDREIILKDKKMDLLKARYPQEVQGLDSQYSAFKAAIKKRAFPSDDTCLGQIDEYFSRLIIRLGFDDNRRGTNVYVVKEGDYFRGIARMFYGNELEWERIFEANKDNKELLPNPDNRDLIYPNVEIIVP
ncbi:MAG: LysM peptidoglycan-binding domain-containing protein [Treponema sp.]|nr:LysM peptidoglycan-binding domain-containing protein [Treponema sp.]